MIKTSLSRNGYKIKKNELSINELKDIKKELTVNPFVVGDFGDGSEKKFSFNGFQSYFFFRINYLQIMTNAV